MQPNSVQRTAFTGAVVQRNLAQRKDTTVSDSEKAAIEIDDKIVSELAVSEPPDEWLRLTRDERVARIRVIIDKHLC